MSRRNSAHSCAASVLFGLRRRTGLWSCSTAQAMTFVLPLPVTPSRTCWVSPDWTPLTDCAMASGWSPAGLKGASTRKREATGRLILRRTDVRKGSRFSQVLAGARVFYIFRPGFFLNLRRCNGAQGNQLRSRRVVRHGPRGIDRSQRHGRGAGARSVPRQELNSGAAGDGNHLPRLRSHRRPPADPVAAQAFGGELPCRVRELHLRVDRFPACAFPRALANLRQRPVCLLAVCRLPAPLLLAACP